MPAGLGLDVNKRDPFSARVSSLRLALHGDVL